MNLSSRDLGRSQARRLTGWLAAGSLAATLALSAVAAASHPAKTTTGSSRSPGSTARRSGGEDGVEPGDAGPSGVAGNSGLAGNSGVTAPSGSSGSPVMSSGAS